MINLHKKRGNKMKRFEVEFYDGYKEVLAETKEEVEKDYENCINLVSIREKGASED